MKFFKYSDYSSVVNSIFILLKNEIESHLPMAKIEHIGSSSIKGAISKGDLDVLVVVEKTNFDDSLERIKSLGYIEKKNTLRTDSLCMLITDKYDYDVAIQLVVNGREQESFVRFRNLLGARPLLLEEYNKLKMSSIDLTEDEYRLRKSKYIQKVLSGE